MTPAEILTFINGGPTAMRLIYPEVGWSKPWSYVFGGVSRDQRLAMVGSGDPYFLFGAYVLRAERLGADRVVASVDKLEPMKQILFERIPQDDQERIAGYTAALDDYDEVSETDGVMGMLNALLDTIQEPTSQRPFVLRHVQWGRFVGDAIEPRGIIMVSEDGSKLTAIPFPGYEQEAARWLAWESVGPRVLEELPDLAGAQTFISSVLTANGSDWDDASNIALFRFGADRYQSTGRSPFA